MHRVARMRARGSIRLPRLQQIDVAVGPLSAGDPRTRIALAHLAAFAAIVVILAVQGGAGMSEGTVLAAVVVGLGFVFLRTLTAGQPLVRSTVALDAVGTVVLLAGTGAPVSPFYLLGVAGAWWAAHTPGRRGALTYGLAFALAYAVLVGPQALRQHLLAEAVEDAVVVVIVAALAGWFVRVDKRALALNEALTVPAFGAEQLAIREGLLRALRTMDIPVDAVIAAGQVGLTAVQAELLAYLMLGLTNVEISDAIGVSEATVRYRLTRLYRVMGVRGRREAAQAAHALGLAPPEHAPG